MHFRHRGAIVAVAVALFLLPLAAVPASATPWEPAPPARAEDGLLAQLWQWLGSLFPVAEDTATPTETTESGTCTTTGGSSRGCAIDPNGSY